MAYLLLRNNKETGPYELNDLLQFGLKPYDLIWIQGKSAAWRYASEVEELKAHAPAVEEQPYDRFFKKSTDTPKEVPVPAEKTIPVPEPESAPEISIEKKYEKYIPKKSVFVTLPGEKKTASIPAPPPEIPAPVIIVKENPAASQIHSSTRLDEIRDMYAKTLQQRKTKIARKSFWITSLKKSAVIASLICLGVLAGFVIKSNSDSRTLARQTAEHPATVVNATLPVPELVTNGPQPEKEIASVNLPVPPETRSAAPTSVEKLQVQKMTAAAAPKEQLLLAGNQVLPPSQKKAVLLPPATEERQLETLVPRQPEKNEVTGERSRTARNNETQAPDNEVQEKPVVKSTRTNSSLAQLVSVTSNDYQKVAFGGIRNLQLTVTNESKYILEKVTVELQYLKPDEKPLRTELIQFSAVSPNSSLTKKIKDTNRGISVVYRIIDIQAPQPATALSGF